MRVTIRDIAKIAGVSHSTVSRSLHDHPSISQQRREQIKQIAEELGFELNSNAVGLRGGNTGTVGIIVTSNISSTFFLDSLIRKITHEERNSFLDYIVTFPTGIGNGNNIRRLVASKKVDGFIIMNPDISAEDFAFLDRMAIPYVLLHFSPRYINIDEVNYFVTDHEYGAEIATSHLLQNGRSNIITITERDGDIQFLQRCKGFENALLKHKFEFKTSMIVEGECTYEFGQEFARNNTDLIRSCDGIFAQADVIALGILSALKDLGIRAPEDVSVIGYDDIKLGEYTSPRLTTIHQPTEDMDHQACRRILELINSEGNAEPVQQVFKPGLVLRDSSLCA